MARVEGKGPAASVGATRRAHCKWWEVDKAEMEWRASRSQDSAREGSEWVQVQSRPVRSRLEERNWEVVGSPLGWRRRLARTDGGGPVVMVWCGKSRGRVWEMMGEGSAKRKWAEWRAGWHDWRAEERVPKAQLTEIQQADRMGWRD